MTLQALDIKRFELYNISNKRRLFMEKYDTFSNKRGI